MKSTPALHWINGEWTDSSQHKDSVNPATSEIINSYADGGELEAELAIAAAASAFKNSAWRRDRKLRARVLNELADIFEKNTDALIQAVILENGKTGYEAGFEVSMVVPCLRYCAALLQAHVGTALQPAEGKYSMVLREPIGVAGIIVPWNAPTILLMRSLAPALAAGATAAIKMPSQTAQVNTLMSKLISESASLPTGVVNMFTESGDSGAHKLVEHRDVAVISYTGSTHVGRAIASAAGKHLKRVNLELGGKTPMIVFDDADLNKLIPTLEKGITVFAGQFCMTGARILVQKGIANQVIEQLKARLEAVKPGPGNNPASDMGPLIDKRSVARVDGAVEQAIKEGAKVIVRGGPALDGALASGAFYRPTLLQVDSVDVDIVQKETFGPVATVEVFETEIEAVEKANATEYGLAAGVWTRDVDRPWRVGQSLSAGTVWINEWAMVCDECEEGGQKQSGLGRLRGQSAMDAFTEIKHYTFAPGALS